MPETIGINTTQNVRLNFEMASLGDRVAAYIIDMVVIVGYVFLFAFTLASLNNPSIAVIILLLTPVIFYHLLFEVFNNGRSIGKMAMRTRVIRMDGTEPRISDFILRWLIGLIELNLMNGIIALVAYLAGGKGQRLGDMAAGTTVAKIKPRVTLEETLYSQTAETYVPTYPEVKNLVPNDIETIKEVLLALRKSASIETVALVEQTKKVIENKLGVKSLERSSSGFLDRVIKDYNHFAGNME